MLLSPFALACFTTMAMSEPGAFTPSLAVAQAPVAAAAKDAGVAAPAATIKREVLDAGTPSLGIGAVVAPLDGGVKRAALAPDVKALVDRVQAFYESTADFTADFRQDYTYKVFKRTQTSTGKVTFKKPALMRWEYQKPSPKTFVLAGNRVFMHDPEAKLVTRAGLASNQLSASVTFLWGQGKLADEFDIVKKACSKCTGTQLELTPLVADPRFKKIYLEVDEKTAMVIKSTVIDPDGSENAISFIALKTNVGVDENYFKLTPPPGTQVQDFLSGGQMTIPGKDAGVASKDGGS